MGLRDQGMIRGTMPFGRRQLGVVTNPTGLWLPRTPVHRVAPVVGPSNPVTASGATSWYDAHDGSGLQQIPSRIGTGVATLGSTTGVDTNDPTYAAGPPPLWAHDGTDDYIKLAAVDTPTTTATTGGYTVIMIVKETAGYVGSNERLFSSEGATNSGLVLRSLATTGPRAYAACNLVTSGAGTAFAINTVIGYALVHDAGNIRIVDKALGGSLATSGNTSTAAAGAMTHGTPRIGSQANTVGSNCRTKVLAVVTYQSAKSNATIEGVFDYLFGTF